MIEIRPGDVDASAGTCSSWTVEGGVKRLTDNCLSSVSKYKKEAWPRVLAASLLYLADFQRPRTTSPEAVSTAPGLISITDGNT